MGDYPRLGFTKNLLAILVSEAPDLPILESTQKLVSERNDCGQPNAAVSRAL